MKSILISSTTSLLIYFLGILASCFLFMFRQIIIIMKYISNSIHDWFTYCLVREFHEQHSGSMISLISPFVIVEIFMFPILTLINSLMITNFALLTFWYSSVRSLEEVILHSLFELQL